MWSEQHVQELVKTIKELREDLEEYDNLNKKMADLLTNTANALHGKPLENGLHSWHDLPELAEKLRKERDEARREVCGLLVACHTDPDDDDKPDPNLKHIHAGIRGWDCYKNYINYKENTNG